ncbi:hypothetical protein BGAPBR_Q0027 (plasmid) [Borreliella garinii PBr]|uniref:Uncharacterized protein n=1 Tax=Borreliella garinii PBr TaxID=498743 RepID=B8F1A4_BORGR|nr:hypothetical protein BGAPBR_Q0027 [Borreliella garinii PBr]
MFVFDSFASSLYSNLLLSLSDIKYLLNVSFLAFSKPIPCFISFLVCVSLYFSTRSLKLSNLDSLLNSLFLSDKLFFTISLVLPKLDFLGLIYFSILLISCSIAFFVAVWSRIPLNLMANLSLIKPSFTYNNSYNSFSNLRSAIWLPLISSS